MAVASFRRSAGSGLGSSPGSARSGGTSLLLPSAERVCLSVGRLPGLQRSKWVGVLVGFLLFFLTSSQLSQLCFQLYQTRVILASSFFCLAAR